jgi:hypothetical protein
MVAGKAIKFFHLDHTPDVPTIEKGLGRQPDLCFLVASRVVLAGARSAKESYAKTFFDCCSAYRQC